MARFDLSDREWAIIAPLLPTDVPGVPRADDRKVRSGIFWRLRTGAPWADIAERYGPHKTCYNRFVRWRRRGVWERILRAVSNAYDGDLQMVDSSSVRVHQHAANGQKRGRSGCMGRSRGGLTTKIHALLDANGLPIGLKRTEGQAHDGRSAADMVGDIGAGQILLADRAYDADSLRESLAERGAWANIALMPNRKRRPAFSAYLDRYRNLVERFFNKLKHFRAIATRYDNDPDNYLPAIQLASARIWIRNQ
ncbi:MAG: IS5 family transposase [Devosia sp.]